MRCCGTCLSTTDMSRSESYRRLVAALPCLRCGIEGFSQAAHSNDARFGKGRGLKADDYATFPLCCQRIGIHGCHYEHDNYLSLSREERPDIEKTYIKQTIMHLYNRRLIPGTLVTELFERFDLRNS
jgi:hypothetical protein